MILVAELSANHGGSSQTMAEGARLAWSMGADMVKIQIYEPQSLTVKGLAASTVDSGPWSGHELFDLYSQGSLPFVEVKRFFDNLSALELSRVFASVFCLEGLNLLAQYTTAHVKIASFEVGHRPLLRRAMKMFETIHVSLGTASSADIEWLLSEAKSAAKIDKLVLYSCVSQYPAKIEDYDLSEVINLAITHGCKYAVSDHTEGESLPLVSKQIGAAFWERHFDPGFGGLDDFFSIDGEGLKRIAELINRPTNSNGIDRTQNFFKRSLYFAKSMSAGGQVTEDDVVCLRPFNGFDYVEFQKLKNRKLVRPVEQHEALSNDLFE